MTLYSAKKINQIIWDSKGKIKLGLVLEASILVLKNGLDILPDNDEIFWDNNAGRLNERWI